MYDLGNVYDAEHQFLEAMRTMEKQSSSDNVKSLLQQHIRQTEQQIQNLEQVYQTMGQQPKRVKCEGADGLVSEAQKVMKETSGNPALMDAAMAGAWARVEHYEIASYRGLIDGARTMGNNQAVRLLEENLNQEEQTAQKVEQNVPQLLKQAMSAGQRGA
ncbi:MAG: YciE/YciF family protein [Herpetosiphonaceae bacterium]|nr:MAG: YciE/YciF family protein [Herpetosiphonaceae bacterium]